MGYIKRKIYVPDGKGDESWWRYEYWKYGWGFIFGLIFAIMLLLLLMVVK